MSLLLYGIVFAGRRHGFEQPQLRLPLGVGGAPVRLIEASGLGAAASSVDSSELTPSVERALAYAEVVEALHADRAVLPLRYGCVLGQESDVVELLRTSSGTYAERLRGLDGCVEMGIRVPTAAQGSTEEGDCGVKSGGRLGARLSNPERAPSRRGALRAPRENLSNSAGEAGLLGACRHFSDTLLDDVSGPFSGMAYLSRRKEFYAEQERRARETAASVQRLRAALAGLFQRCKTEHCAASGPRPIFHVPLLSLHFLVKRERLPSFRAAVLRIDLIERAPLLLSGPWPPYNFAAPDPE